MQIDSLKSLPIKKVNQLTANIITPTTIGLDTCVLNRTVSGDIPMGNDSQQHSGIMAFDTVEECKLFETENIFGDSDILNFICEQSNNNTPSAVIIPVNNPTTDSIESTVISTTTSATTENKMFDQVKYEDTYIFDDDFLYTSQEKNFIDNEELDIFNGEPILIHETNEPDHNYCSVITNDDGDLFNNNIYYDIPELNKALIGNPMLGTGISDLPLSQTSLDIKPTKLPSSQNSLDFTTFKQSLSQESTINLAEYTSIDDTIKNDIDFDTITNNVSSSQQQLNNSKIFNDTTICYKRPIDNNIGASSQRKVPKLKIQLGKNISIIPAAAYISTPDVCENVLSLEEDKIKNEFYMTAGPSKDQRSETPTPDARSLSPSTTIQDNPPSVQSYISDDFTTSSNISTAPPTPSYSTISSSTSDASPNTQQQRQQKKPRGRPPKKHSTQPDPNKLRNLSEKDRRYLEQRYKNNEASRQSRLNRKRKEDLDKQELDREEERNQRLRARLDKLKTDEDKLKSFLFLEMS